MLRTHLISVQSQNKHAAGLSALDVLQDRVGIRKAIAMTHTSLNFLISCT